MKQPLCLPVNNLLHHRYRNPARASGHNIPYVNRVGGRVIGVVNLSADTGQQHCTAGQGKRVGNDDHQGSYCRAYCEVQNLVAGNLHSDTGQLIVCPI